MLNLLICSQIQLELCSSSSSWYYGLQWKSAVTWEYTKQQSLVIWTHSRDVLGCLQKVGNNDGWLLKQHEGSVCLRFQAGLRLGEGRLREATVEASVCQSVGPTGQSLASAHGGGGCQWPLAAGRQQPRGRQLPWYQIRWLGITADSKLSNTLALYDLSLAMGVKWKPNQCRENFKNSEFSKDD